MVWAFGSDEDGRALACFHGVNGLSGEAAEQGVERVACQHMVAGKVYGGCGDGMAADGCK